VKWNFASRICDGTDNSQARPLIKEVVANYKSRSTPLLLMAGLRIKAKRNPWLLPHF
jgi:hypothetical protein